jgi:CheY-like chemotaxis protein
VSLKLLIVEDDLPSLELMAEVFTSLKAEVCPVSDSAKAANLVNQEKFDGIFLDLEMPNMNGFDLAQCIRASSWNRSTPIVIVTGRDDRRTMQDVFAIGATFFLQKPVDRQRLSGLFRTVKGALLENRRRHTRVPLQTPVICDAGSRNMQGVSWNLSSGGIQVEIGNLRPGDAVKLSWRLPRSGIAIEAAGVVIWEKGQRQGIQFTKMSTQTRETLQQYIAEADTHD